MGFNGAFVIGINLLNASSLYLESTVSQYQLF